MFKLLLSHGLKSVWFYNCVMLTLVMAISVNNPYGYFGLLFIPYICLYGSNYTLALHKELIPELNGYLTYYKEKINQNFESFTLPDVLEPLKPIKWEDAVFPVLLWFLPFIFLEESIACVIALIGLNIFIDAKHQYMMPFINLLALILTANQIQFYLQDAPLYFNIKDHIFLLSKLDVLILVILFASYAKYKNFLGDADIPISVVFITLLPLAKFPVFILFAGLISGSGFLIKRMITGQWSKEMAFGPTLYLAFLSSWFIPMNIEVVRKLF